MWLKIDLPGEDWEYLKTCARIRQTSMRGLCGKLLHAIAEGQLTLAILEDESRPIPGRKYKKYRYEIWSQ